MKTFLYNQIGATEDILKTYADASMTVTQLASKYNVTPRTIQRLVKAHGQIRTIAEANKITAKLKNYEALKVPEHLKAKRKMIPRKLRYEILLNNTRCNVCGASKNESYLQIDHIDGDASNNNKENLQVLCILCNQGKM